MAGDLPAPLLKKSEETRLSAYDLSLLKEAKNQFEREFIIHKLQENQGNISQTAAVLGIERSHLHKKIKAYGIKAEDGE
jgi:two-component system nitrogen regulation response regulator NtrX